jgi:hypothetical protein
MGFPIQMKICTTHTCEIYLLTIPAGRVEIAARIDIYLCLLTWDLPILISVPWLRFTVLQTKEPEAKFMNVQFWGFWG